MSSIRLIAGLGNPGKEHERTRHNAGFWLVERFAASNGIALRKDAKFQALVGRHSSGAFLLLPQTYMNLSGMAVRMLSSFFKIAPGEILVVHDEVDFAPGIARLKQGGGIAGHNGLKDISQRLSSHDYWRLRLGIGHPGDKNAVPDYVLGRPTAGDKAAIDEAIARSIDVLPLILAGDMQGAMQKLHTDPVKPKPEPTAEPKAEAPKAAPEPAARTEPQPEPKPEAKVPPKPEPVAAESKEGGLKGLFGLLKPKRGK